MRAKLLEDAIRRREASLLATGAVAVQTGRHTGRAANSRFIVRDEATSESVDWGEVNRPLERARAREVFVALSAQLGGADVYRVRGFIGPFPIEVVTKSAWHAAFAENMFRESAIHALAVQAGAENAESFGVIRVWHDPTTPASRFGIEVAEDALILLDPSGFEVAIAGTAYAGEIKKSAFSMANFLLPIAHILSMHASANCREDGSDACVIFGLSGTGKTTLSAQPGRFLIGDDEIAWSDRGLSNLEGGCYAKLINLRAEQEPEIHTAVRRFGSILENVVFDPESRAVDFSSSARTENTRGSYKLSALERVFDQSREAEPPKCLVFLTADAFGAMPAIARLDEWQMRYHFMSGFTAKVAGTEIGLKEPKAAFSACFGAPFMPRAPSVYAGLLAAKAAQAQASVWLLNTGWIGGFELGKRFPLEVTRRLLELAQSGALDHASFDRHPIFGFEVPRAAPGVQTELLKAPQGPQVESLAGRFIANQKKFKDRDAQVICARGGPSVAASSLASSPSSQSEAQV